MNCGTQRAFTCLFKSKLPYPSYPSSPSLSTFCSPSFLSLLFPFFILGVFGLPWVLTEQLSSSAEACEGASEGGGEAWEVRKGMQGQEAGHWTTTLAFTFHVPEYLSLGIFWI